MAPLDWAIVGVYLVGTLAVGLWLSRRASGGVVDFFVGGRALPWWLAGTSIVATTFAADTPLVYAWDFGGGALPSSAPSPFICSVMRPLRPSAATRACSSASSVSAAATAAISSASSAATSGVISVMSCTK